MDKVTDGAFTGADGDTSAAGEGGADTRVRAGADPGEGAGVNGGAGPEEGAVVAETRRPSVDADTVRALLREQHPDLADADVHSTVTGWDNQLWRLGDDLAVRVPRTPRAPGLLRKESAWLPSLAPLLPLPVPTPLRTGAPSARFPGPWNIVRWVPGTPADRTPVTRGADAADRLAAFLRALHAPAPADAPAGGGRVAPLRTLAGAFERWLGEVSGLFPDTTAVRELWRSAVEADEWRGAPVWLHGDLHPANVTVRDGTLAGVLDFGELCTGDPSADLAAAWLLLPADAVARCLDAYGPPDEATVLRARGRALLQCFALVSIGEAGERGLPGGKTTWGHAGRAALARLLPDAPPATAT
ncbi:phosphotransferase [Streptomyces sp. NPDC050560]|uniref:phosphotransferase n=1 Tax=Streptomyces sp. NPDC050560 TaxID=3365630 RepID=UPI0037A6F264